VDVAVLTFQLYLSGGITNPFAFLYLMQIILGRAPEALVELGHRRRDHGLPGGIGAFSEPLALPPDHNAGLLSLYVEGTLICFLLNAGLMVFFITRISSNLRAGDARWPTCASARPKKTTSCAWACWPPARRTNWARRWPPCR
jgi:two-component system sensor histidine kinase RegB